MEAKKPSPLSSPTAPSPASGHTAAAFPIIGMGASAGGLEAFEQFFRIVPSDIGMAFVLVSHLDPSHSSLLTDILQRTTTMPVMEAQDQVLVEPNCVYVIPPNRDMTIFHGKLQLSMPSEPRGQRMPIDTFLRSLAEDQQENSIGIILSGTGTDGTLGLRAIFGSGGITLVQEPGTAKYDGMPSSAIQSGYTTHILPVNKMPEALISGVCSITGVTASTTKPNVESGMNHILRQLRTITGHDFSLYKKNTIVRRIERRMSQHTIEDTDVYIRFLKENSAEVHQLFKELLINVTSFFRDPEAFDVLKREILPQLCEHRSDDSVFRIWVAGCATGEETYSIAIVLRELMEAMNQNLKVQIYSTDLDDDAIANARAGFYPPNIAQDVTAERLRRFFIKEENGYRIKKDIREMVVFAVQNVIKDPPFTKLDLLSCRNLMIYMEAELQNRLLLTFHYALKPGGVLFLSPSESIGNHVELFSSLNRKWKFYRSIHAVASLHAMKAPDVSWAAENRNKDSEGAVNKIKETNYAEFTRRILMQCFAPPSVVTDLKGNTLFVHGDTGKYLRPAPGHASLNVIEMAREGLEAELHAAIHAAEGEGRPTLNKEVQVKTNGGVTAVNLNVRLVPGLEGNQNLLLLSFQDIAGPAAKRARKRVGNPAERLRIEELERELAYLKESHQVSDEELKSTNEEMQATNEELQSTNEELETSKEELQSINEELITVNSELQIKIEQLAGVQNDMKNLLANINIGLIFLDRHLVIRSFNQEALRIYRLVASDVGRPLNDIKSLAYEVDLTAASQTVLESLIPYEREIQINVDTWMLARIQPYRTMENMIDGVVLTFTDISSRIKAVAAQQSQLLAEGIVNTVRESLIVLDGTLKVVTASRSFYREFQSTPEDTVDRQIYELGNRQWDIPALRELLKCVIQDGQSFENYEIERDFPLIGHRMIRLNARSIEGLAGEPHLILLAMEIIP